MESLAPSVRKRPLFFGRHDDMPFRPRLFVKKRGTRRTGSRWAGKAAEALLFLALIGIGAYAMYWLIDRAILVEDASPDYWPWFAMLIPVGLLAYGLIGLVMLAWESSASTERRAAAVQRATEWEIPGRTMGSRPTAPAVPPIDAIVDSPGIELPYRLPIDAASGWVSFTMAAVCLAWNTLVLVFVIEVIGQHLDGRPNWLLTWLLVPFVMAGLWTLVALGRQIWLTISVGTTRLEVSHHPLYPGGTYKAYVSQSGRLQFRWFQIQLVCEEQAVYQQGTDTRRDTARVYSHTAFSDRKFEITPGQALETRLEFTIPPTAMHSFASVHNAIIWAIIVRGRIARWGDFERRFPVYVYPATAAEPLTDRHQTASDIR